MRKDIAYVQAEPQMFTTWRNPTPHEMKVDIYEHPGRPRKRYVFPPNKEVQVPSEYDRAIQRVRAGVIVGGLAPLLERAMDDGRVLHPALDPEAAAKKTAADAEERAVLATKAANDVLARTPKSKA